MLKRREIGSEFHINNELVMELEYAKDNIISYLKPYNMFFYDSGRSALQSLLKNINFQKVLLPDYICESVRKCFPGSKVIYYHIDDDFHIDWEDLIEKCKNNIDILYLHYFNGYIGKEYDFDKLSDLKNKNNFLIIEDTTHSFLSCKHTIGDYCICSLRKWFPIPDGGVLYSEKTLNYKGYRVNTWSSEKRFAMSNKGLYLKGENIKKEDFLLTFAKTEEILDSQTEPFSISKESYEALKYISINRIAETRYENYITLSKSLKFIKAVAMGGGGQIPLFYTISVENRDILRKYLIDNNIYCPIHWPLYSELENIEEVVNNNKKELSIPIDQRYGQKDMKYIINIINKYIDEHYGDTRRNK